MSRKSARKSQIMNSFGQPPLTTQVVRTTLNKRSALVMTPVRIVNFGGKSSVIK
jgi:hypothetical protein